MCDRPRQAWRLLTASLAEAERQEARFEHVQSQLARARVGRLLGWPRADQEEAEALDAQAALGLDRDTTRAEREALLLADRCAALLIAGQNIFSARTRSPILDAVRQAVLSLLPAGRCVILDATLPPRELEELSWEAVEARVARHPLGKPR